MNFAMHLQASMFPDMNSYPGSMSMLPELYRLSLHCPLVWIDGYLALCYGQQDGKKISVKVLHTEQAK